MVVRPLLLFDTIKVTHLANDVDPTEPIACRYFAEATVVPDGKKYSQDIRLAPIWR
ncbi:Hypothetical protein UVM_LOCUS496 [uncultured virus]|nr:Hypothetical protein UVM_LOCUS496 [uncultured virus]